MKKELVWKSSDVVISNIARKEFMKEYVGEWNEELCDHVDEPKNITDALKYYQSSNKFET